MPLRGDSRTHNMPFYLMRWLHLVQNTAVICAISLAIKTKVIHMTTTLPILEKEIHHSSMTAGRALVAALKLNGVDRIFCVPGESYLEVLDALHDEKNIELIVAKHEGAAANMAEADGKLTGRPGICMVTRGPGATHASVGVHIAQQDSTPMILFIGQVARNHRGRDAFQEIDYQQMFGSIAKLVMEIDDPSRVPELIARAFQVAVSGRPGPVVISLPEDMLIESIVSQPCRATPMETATPGKKTMHAIEEQLKNAKNPLVIVGGSNWSETACSDLKMFLQRWNLPAACAFRRQDIIDNELPNYVGHLSLGMSPALQNMVEHADVLLVIGTRLGDVPTNGYTLLDLPRPHQRLIHCHPDPAELGRIYQSTIAVPIETAAVVEALANSQTPPVCTWNEWTANGRHAFEQFTSKKESATAPDGVDLIDVVLHMSDTLTDNAILTNGAGNYSVWLHRYYRYRSPRTELASTCGSMGYGLPAAVAAALRHRDRAVVCVAGDGCFMMYPQEIATAIEHELSLIILVVNNGMYGTIRMHQERDYPGRVSGTKMAGPDYTALARSFGARAERVHSSTEFTAVFDKSIKAGGVTLIELVTDPMQLTPDKRLTVY